MNETQEFIIEHLSCVICEDIKLESLQCFNGHPHCKSCLKNFEHSWRKQALRCSICRSRKAWASIRPMFQIADKLNVNVPCGIEGCTEKLPISLVEAHRKKCSHKLFTCPINNSDCPRLYFTDIIDHLLTNHKTKITNMKPASILHISINDSMISFSKIIIFNENIISLCITMSANRHMEPRIHIKGSLLGYEGCESKICMHIWQWNLIYNQYSHSCLELESGENITLDNPLIVLGIRNFSNEASHDKTIDWIEDTSKNPSVNAFKKKGIRAHEYDSDEDFEEMYALSIKFEQI